MLTINLTEAKADLSNLVDEAIKGGFVTITRHGRPVAALVSIEAAEMACKATEKGRPSLVVHLKTLPGDALDRNPAPSRN